MKLLLIAAIFLLAGCPHVQKPACQGYERTETGSTCRDTKSGEFVSTTHCEEC